MIEKSRLEELIKQGATIYTILKETFIAGASDLVKLKEIKLDEFFSVSNNALMFPDLLYIKIEDLYETKKQAEWALKYQRIPRTEYLDLPTWEEFDKNNKTICFIAKDWQCYELGFAFGDTETICLDKVVLGVNTNQKTWKATEENYIKACNVALKLFKGENNDK